MSFPSYALHRLIEMKIQAMCDCILRVETNPIEMTHHRYVRAEAILALARWQCENASHTGLFVFRQARRYGPDNIRLEFGLR